MESDWKTEHANESGKAVRHPLVADVIEELIGNLGCSPTGLEAYGIRKVATYAAQVARAQALGIDPDSLRSTPEESNAAMMRIAGIAARAGKDVIIIDEMVEDRPVVVIRAEDGKR